MQARLLILKSLPYNEQVDYSPREIIHIKENSFYSIYRGVSRLKARSSYHGTYEDA